MIYRYYITGTIVKIFNISYSNITYLNHSCDGNYIAMYVTLLTNYYFQLLLIIYISHNNYNSD